MCRVVDAASRGKISWSSSLTAAECVIVIRSKIVICLAQGIIIGKRSNNGIGSKVAPSDTSSSITSTKPLLSQVEIIAVIKPTTTVSNDRAAAVIIIIIIIIIVSLLNKHQSSRFIDVIRSVLLKPKYLCT